MKNQFIKVLLFKVFILAGANYFSFAQSGLVAQQESTETPSKVIPSAKSQSIDGNPSVLGTNGQLTYTRPMETKTNSKGELTAKTSAPEQKKVTVPQYQPKRTVQSTSFKLDNLDQQLKNVKDGVVTFNANDYNLFVAQFKSWITQNAENITTLSDEQVTYYKTGDLKQLYLNILKSENKLNHTK